MKLIIAGGRDYTLTAADYEYLSFMRTQMHIDEVVSGGATGADACGELWAVQCGIPVKRFKADWDAHGNAAGPIRNREMAQYADAVALYPGGRGTSSMKREAEKAGITIYDRRGK